MYVCHCCGARFLEAAIERYREDMDGEGAMQEYTVLRCPECGEEHIEVEECGNI